MAGLPKSIIAKYGVSKKAWSVFKSRSSSSPAARKTPMARRRFSRVRKTGRRFGRFAKRATDTRTNLGSMVIPFIYGALRPAITQAIAPLTSKIPVVGQYADEAGMIAIGAAANMWGSGSIKAAGKFAMQAEAFSLGMQVVSPLISGLTSGMTTSSSTNSGLFVNN